ncbi:hypothetical protein DdX_19593 [Ditylenchus destructor]|uniref:HTH CENPB-type domain-containing protein n=1 Tax=Ditylenchus destructor TaxID=166010 RepID=A0AAD4MIK4_9BILA|nr:hypothetical protein DdX_19593 [Ditylenchus destructor]
MNLRSLEQSKSSSRDGKSKRKLGCGRKVSYENLDNDLAKWVRQRRKEKKKVSRRIIKLQAESSFNGSEDDLIHCFKEAGPVPEGRKLLEDARAGINDEPLQIEDEEFEVEEDTMIVIKLSNSMI